MVVGNWALGVEFRQLVNADVSLLTGNVIAPAGDVRTGALDRITPSNAIVNNLQELANLPIRTGTGPTVFMHDVGTVEDGSDITLGYALVNGQRTVYLPVTKRADASTLTVVNEVKSSLGHFANALPPDVKVSYEFDQSGRVRSSLMSLFWEGVLGAVLTGLMVFLFLREGRSSFIVISSIPFALITPAAERHLICSRCTLRWKYETLTCPFCHNAERNRITSFATPDGRYRVYACDACRRYLKAYDGRRASRPVMPMVDAVATLPLDAAAMQRGYSS